MPDIFLEYGVNSDGEYIHIGQVGRGRVDLVCPYCGVGLLARKGLKVAAHFAHDGNTCNAASRNPDVIALPYFDRFGVDIPGKVLERLKQWDADKRETEDYQLVKHELIQARFNGRRMVYELSHKGKIVLGQLSLDLFNKFQEPLIIERHNELVERARVAQGTPTRLQRLAEIDALLMEIPAIDIDNYARRRVLADERRALQRFDNGLDFNTALIDLQLYRRQWQRVLSCSLYFLEVTHSGGQLHKIGVTTRSIAERLAEISDDLAPLVGETSIKVLDIFPYRGNVELYFKYRYQAQRADVGGLTEYFTFEKASDVTRDLRRMQDKTLSELEREVLTGQADPLTREIETAHIEARRREAIRAGLQRASSNGQAIGRPRRETPETPQEILGREFAPRVLAALDSGLSLRKAADVAGVSVNTVRKVQAARDADAPTREDS